MFRPIYAMILLGLLPVLLKVGLDFSWVRKNISSQIITSWSENHKINSKFDKPEIFIAPQDLNVSIKTAVLDVMDTLLGDGGIEGIHSLRVSVLEDQFFRVKIESFKTDGTKIDDWRAKRRLPNNGIFLGPWLFLFCLAICFTKSFAFFASIFGTLFWYSGWKVFLIPEMVLQIVKDVFGYLRHFDGVLSLGVAQSIGFQMAALFLGLFLSWLFFQKIFRSKNSTLSWPIIIGWFLFDYVVIIGIFKVFGALTPKMLSEVFLISLFYRFFSVALITLLGKDTTKFLSKQSSKLDFKFILIPILFILCQSSSWLLSALSSYESQTLYLIKIFVVTFLFGFISTNRLFSVVIFSLTIATLIKFNVLESLNPMVIAFGLEGIVAGTLMSVFHLQERVDKQARKKLHFLCVSSLVFGFCFSAVGAPVVFVWIFILASVWTVSLFEGPRSPFHLDDV